MKEKLRHGLRVCVLLSPYLAMVFFMVCIVIYSYTQRYVKQDKHAISGIIFTDEIDLEIHKSIGKGNGLFGAYESYTRSDRNEFIKVYYK